MPNAFEEAISNSSFKLRELKENEINSILNSANDLYEYISKFLPLQLCSGKNSGVHNGQEDVQDSDGGLPVMSFGKASRAKTIEELHKRIETLRGKKTYKEKLLKKGLKNRLKKKQKLEERKQMKNIARKQAKQEKNEIEEVEELKDQKPAKETENSLQFSKIIVSSSDVNQKNQVSDPKRLLQKVEKANKKLKMLEIKGKKDKLQEIKTKKTWDAAIQKAEGVKVKDDVELLKKSISKIKQRKAKSKKKWEERENAVKNKKEETQKKRQENINKKKQERKKKRTKVLVKKGRILPR